MYLDERYTMYKLACQLADKDNFEPLYVNGNQEIWLERLEGKTSQVIRLFHGGFDWKNHLKKDIGQVFQKTKAMRRHLRGKYVSVHNVYIDSHEPVDDWKILKRQMQLNEKKPIRMNVYYLSDNGKETELDRLREVIGGTFQNFKEELSETDKESEVDRCQRKIAGRIKQKEEERQRIFSYGKPILTYGLLAINIIIFLLLELNGDSTSTSTLIEFGAKFNPAIIEHGEWWRILSSMFLHIGVLHLLMNMLAVYYLGTAVERIYGSLRFSVIYLLAGIGGGLASFAFTANVSAGASGALFGLFGALLFFGCIYRRIFFQTMGMNLLIIIVINIIFGLSVPQVDNGAHMGGLISGFIASAILYLPKKKNGMIQLSAVITYLLLVSGLVAFGLENNYDSPSYHLMKAEQLMANEQYDEAIDAVTEGLRIKDDIGDELASQLLFQRSYSHIQLNNTRQAINDLEQSIELNGELAQAHYNIAILYNNNGAKDKAAEHIEKAYRLEPDNPDIAQLYEQLTQTD